MKSIGLARIVLDGRHVTGLRYGLDDANVAAVLTSRGISVRLYCGKSEGRVLDLARQLVRMRVETYLLWVCPETLAVTAELVRELRTITPGCRVLFWGNSQGANPVILESLSGHIEILSAASVAELFVTPLFAEIGDVAETTRSPYLDGLLGYADALRLGFTPDTGLSRFADEVAWLATTECGSDGVIPLECHRATEQELIQICLIIAAATCRFRIYADASACSEALFRVIPAARIEQLHIAGDATALSAAAEAFKSVIVLDTPQQRATHAATYGKNGNVVLHTGYYFDAKQAPGIYHLEVPLAMPIEQRTEVYSWAASAMDIRSAAVLTGAGSAIDARLPDFEAPSSCETGGWPKHIYALGIDTETNTGAMTFDGEISSRQSVRYVPLSELDMTEPADATLTFITMKTESDVAELERRLARFHRDGELSARHPRYTQFYENSCRWMNFGFCRLPLLRRIQVDQSMGIRSCRDAGQLGKVGDTYDQIVVQVKKHQQIEEIRRECSTCSVRDKCSHCTQLPNEWGGRYCEIRKKYELTSLYFELCALLPMLGPVLAGLSDSSVSLTVSYAGLQNHYYRGPVGEARRGARPVIVNVGGQHIAWIRGTRKNIRLSAPLATMAEAWWLGAREDDIVDSLSAVFTVDADTARSSLATGMEKLRAEGLAYV